MSDLISREGLLKQIEIDSNEEPGYYGDTWKFIDTIKNMPSAQPETHEKRTETHACDCISRQAAIAIAKDLLIHLEEYHQYNQAINNYCAEIIKLPSAQPETCGTCKHGYFGDTQCDNCCVRYPSHYERRTDE